MFFYVSFSTEGQDVFVLLRMSSVMKARLGLGLREDVSYLMYSITALEFQRNISYQSAFLTAVSGVLGIPF